VLRAPRTLGYAAVNALTFGGLFAYISASPSVFIGTLGVTPGVFSLPFAPAALVLLAGSILNGLLARRLSTAFLERLGPALLGVALVLMSSTACWGWDARMSMAVRKRVNLARGKKLAQTLP